MMSLQITSPSLILLVIVNGAVAQYGWSVNYSPKSICALKGSTVNMDCSYTYPSDYTIQKAFWSKELVTDEEPPDLLEDPEYRDRVQYLGDKSSYCTLRLRDVREKDQRKYYFRFLTDEGGKFQGKDGVDLSVTDLQVEVPERVIEGGKVTLTCKTTCILTVRPTFTWYRNGAPLSSRTDQLHLQSVSREDADRYHCAVEGQKLHSPEVTLNVRYGPKSMSVSISPSGEIVEGSSVILTCSSDGNPPVQKYTWFKGTSLVATEETFTMEKISSVDSGEYKCRSSNEHGRKYSDTVTLNVLYPPKNISVSISPSGEIVEGSSVTLTCSSDGNPPVEYTWFKETSLVAIGETFTMKKISSVNSGEYKCRSSNEHGRKYSDTVTLNVLYPPKNISVSISPSGEIVEGSSVTLTCSSDGDPPVQKYTWFKEGGSSPVASGHNYSFTLDSKSIGRYSCEAQNGPGSKKSDAVLLNFKEVQLDVTRYVIVLVVVGCGVLFLVLVILLIRRKRRGPVAEDPKSIQENIYSNVAMRAAANDPPPDEVDDYFYATVQPPRPKKNSNEVSSADSHEEGQYGNIQCIHNEEMQKSEDDIQYARVSFSPTAPAYRSAVPEDTAVIYSGVKYTTSEELFMT